MIQAKNDSVLDKGRNGGDEKWSNSGHDLKEHFGALPMLDYVEWGKGEIKGSSQCLA